MNEAQTARQRFWAPDHTMKEHHMAAAILTAERLQEVLDYDPETGVFVWKRKTGSRAKPGQVAGNAHSLGYRFLCVDGRRYKEHRLAWLYVHNVWPLGDVDHIDGRRDNNAICNLRDVSRSVNAQNMRLARAHSAAGLLGVRKTKNGRWCARINIGTYDTPEEAHAAYIEAKRRLHPGCTI
jgi:hypothetical protein